MIKKNVVEMVWDDVKMDVVKVVGDDGECVIDVIDCMEGIVKGDVLDGIRDGLEIYGSDDFGYMNVELIDECVVLGYVLGVKMLKMDVENECERWEMIERCEWDDGRWDDVKKMFIDGLNKVEW